ncbi:hypothetical protein [Rhizobium sp. MHM7A]|uniref:hypothetical protein n=1 Tax=Rhizobium sp. MHM7A TaxID=2583233 RepID=UPI001105B7AA|nr:hypothetical protein [Rhizobium sp. MHM7A]TLX17204.1 hypothetical protein FFR93_07795 [Rhizobium sp. MHM7A]
MFLPIPLDPVAVENPVLTNLCQRSVNHRIRRFFGNEFPARRELSFVLRRVQKSFYRIHDLVLVE